MSNQYSEEYLAYKINFNTNKISELRAKLEKIDINIDEYDALRENLEEAIEKLTESQKDGETGKEYLHMGLSGNKAQSITRSINLTIEGIETVISELIQIQSNSDTEQNKLVEEYESLKQQIASLERETGYLRHELNMLAKRRTNEIN